MKRAVTWIGEWSGVWLFACMVYAALDRGEVVFAIWFVAAMVQAWAAIMFRRLANDTLSLARSSVTFTAALVRIASMQGTDAMEAPSVALDTLREEWRDARKP